MKNNKKISIIVPAYNAENTINRCILSLINQTYTNLEIIIINDGSLDNTGVFCQQLSLIDSRIIFINNKNHGVSYSRNQGMKLATGDFITFVDADDYLDTNCFEELSFYFDNDIDFIRYNFNSNKKSFNNDLFELKNKKINLNETKDVSLYSHFFTSDNHIPNLVFLLLIKSDIIKNIKFNEKLYMMEDVDFYLQLFKTSKVGYFLDLKLYNYNINDSSVTHNISNYKKNILGIIESNKSIISGLNDVFDLSLLAKVNSNHYRIILNHLIELSSCRDSLNDVDEILNMTEFKNLEKLVRIKNLPNKNKLLYLLSNYGLHNLFVLVSKFIVFLQKHRKINKYKVGILTINDNNNYGNRLQNYALQEYLKSTFDVTCETVWNNINRSFYWRLKREIKNFIKLLLKNNDGIRYYNFKKFSKKIKHSRYKINNSFVPKQLNFSYDYFITGSDQVWNPNHNRLTKNDLLSFASPEKRVAYAASFGVSKIEKKYVGLLKNELEKFNLISVREDDGKKIIEKETGLKNAKVLIDPTMLLTCEQWSSIVKKPNQLKNKDFILCYFLGKIDNKLEHNIKKYADKNNLDIINILDKNSNFYNCGPDEFLYLEKHAKLICTDSFHSCVFAIIFNTPFQIFERNDEHLSMNSRLNTLLKKFNLEDRKCNINDELQAININAAKVNQILNLERDRSYEYFYSLFK